MPTLTVLAGPNGAGKTIFSELLLQQNLISTQPYNHDFVNREAISELLSGNVYSIEKEITKIKDKLFFEACQGAIHDNVDFSFESNLRKGQLKNIALFERAGYKLNLIYFILDTIALSHERVKYRVEVDKGNYVDAESINHNFTIGLKNLDLSYDEWDQLTMINNSKNINEKSRNFFELSFISEKGKIVYYDKNFPPSGLRKYLPQISKEIDKRN